MHTILYFITLLPASVSHTITCADRVDQQITNFDRLTCEFGSIEVSEVSEHVKAATDRKNIYMLFLV
jgi:hypothetical protein